MSEETDIFKNDDDENEGLLDEMDFDDPLTMKDMDESDEEKSQTSIITHLQVAVLQTLKLFVLLVGPLFCLFLISHFFHHQVIASEE